LVLLSWRKLIDNPEYSSHSFSVHKNIAGEEDIGLLEKNELFKKVLAKASLGSGETLEGTFLFPNDSTREFRLLDCLNRSDYFLPMLSDDSAYYISQKYICRIIEKNRI